GLLGGAAMRRALRAGGELSLMLGKGLLFVPPPLAPPHKGEGNVGVPEVSGRRRSPARFGFLGLWARTSRSGRGSEPCGRIGWTDPNHAIELQRLLRSPLWGGVRGGGSFLPGSPIETVKQAGNLAPNLSVGARA